MRLDFTKERIVKKYNMEYTENIRLGTKINENVDKKIKIAFEFDGNIVSFFQLADVKNEEGDAEKILEVIESILGELKFKLDNEGKVEKLANISSIKNKWSELNMKTFSHLDKEHLQDFVFEISKIILNESLLLELTKNYLILPYIFVGLYNKELSINEPQRLETTIYNVLPLANIPVQLEIYGNEDEDNDKILNFEGAPTYDFDRFEYLSLLEEKYPELKDIEQDSLEVKLEGQYVYDEYNCLVYFDVELEIKAKELLLYKQSYVLREDPER